jgi:hypothetical protein
LILALEKDHTGIVQYLLSNKADANAKDGKGNNALILALEKGHTEIVQYLLSNNADANAKDGKGNSALILASEKGHTGLVQYLLTNKADVEAKQKDGWASLHFASQKGHDKVAELLVVRDEGQGRGKCLYMQDQGRCGGGRMSVIDLYLHRHLYGSMCRCLFIYIYMTFIHGYIFHSVYIRMYTYIPMYRIHIVRTYVGTHPSLYLGG